MYARKREMWLLALPVLLRAADVSDPEGLFLMGWVWQHGIGSHSVRAGGSGGSGADGDSPGSPPDDLARAREYYELAVEAAPTRRCARALGPLHSLGGSAA